MEKERIYYETDIEVQDLVSAIWDMLFKLELDEYVFDAHIKADVSNMKCDVNITLQDKYIKERLAYRASLINMYYFGDPKLDLRLKMLKRKSVNNILNIIESYFHRYGLNWVDER